MKLFIVKYLDVFFFCLLRILILYVMILFRFLRFVSIGFFIIFFFSLGLIGYILYRVNLLNVVSLYLFFIFILCKILEIWILLLRYFWILLFLFFDEFVRFFRCIFWEFKSFCSFLILFCNFFILVWCFFSDFSMVVWNNFRVCWVCWGMVVEMLFIIRFYFVMNIMVSTESRNNRIRTRGIGFFILLFFYVCY